jgi:hypothetical protein
MKKTVYRAEFIEEFKVMGRNESFSYAGLSALFHYLTELEEGTGIETELDIGALCCDFWEATLDEIRNDGLLPDRDEGEDDYDYRERCLDALRCHTEVIEVSDETVIIQRF